MAFSAYEIRRLKKIISGRINKDQDHGFHIEAESVVLFELKPDLKHPGEMLEAVTAKARYDPAKQHWKVYWQAQGKWRGYEPTPRVNSIEEFLALVADNIYGCFHA